MRAKDEWALVERMMTGDYSPDQPRDENGRWIDQGGAVHSNGQNGAYRCPYISAEEREQFKAEVDKVKRSWDFNPYDPKSYIRLGKAIQDEVARRFKLRKKNEKGLVSDQPQTEDIYDVLRDIRSFGAPEGQTNVQISFSGLDDDFTQTVFNDACSRFPSDWFTGENSSRGCTVNMLDMAGRATCAGGWQFPDGRSHITVFGRLSEQLVNDLHLSSDKVPEGGLTNELAHEMAHHFEESNYLLGSLARDYLNSRTKGEPLQEIYPAEYSRPDKFADAYMGKEYLDGSTEITSVLIQKLGWVDPRQAIVENIRGAEHKDYNSYKFILGVLAGDI